MATKKSVGKTLGRLAIDVIKKSISKEPIKRKTTRGSRPKKPKVNIVTPVSPQQQIWGTQPSQDRKIFTTNTSDFRRKVRESIARSPLYSRWNSLGKRTSDVLVKEKLIDVSEESENNQRNFETISNQIAMLSNFMIKTDYRFNDLGRAIEKNFVDMADVLTKNQIMTMNVVNKELTSLDRNITKISSKLEVHDRQIDELYGRMKSDQSKGSFASFLDRKKQFQNQNKSSSMDEKKEDDASYGPGFTGYGFAGDAAAVGGGVAALALRKKIGAAGKKVVSGTAAALKNTGKVVGRLGARVGARLAPVAGGAIAGPAGIIAGIGVAGALTAKDFYDGYQKDGVWGGIKNTATLGFAYGDDEKQSQDIKSEINKKSQPIYLESTDTISLISKKDIKLETTANIVIKATNKITLDAAKVEIRGLNLKNTGQQKNSEKEEESWWDGINKKLSGTNDTVGAPYMGRGSTLNRERMARESFGKPGSMVRNGRGYTVAPGGINNYQYQKSDAIQKIMKKPIKPQSALDKLVQGASSYEGIAPDHSQGGTQRYNTSIPASIRHNNPGATYPADWMKDFGMDGVDVIGGGHKIANFPDAISGAAANMNLFYKSKKYAGKPLGEAIATWSGGNSVNEYLKNIENETGLTASDVITQDMIKKNPKVLVSLLKAQAKHESGKKDFEFLTDEQWDAAVKKFRQIGLGEKVTKGAILPGMKKIYDREQKNYSLLEKSKSKRKNTHKEISVTKEEQITRPNFISGKLVMEGESYDFGSGNPRVTGGDYGKGSIPYGTFNITGPGEKEAITDKGIWTGGKPKFRGNSFYIKDMFDPKWNTGRAGILIHSASNLDALYTAGCIGISPKEWPKFRSHLIDYMQKNDGKLSITVNQDGSASIGPRGIASKNISVAAAAEKAVDNGAKINENSTLARNDKIKKVMKTKKTVDNIRTNKKTETKKEKKLESRTYLGRGGKIDNKGKVAIRDGRALRFVDNKKIETPGIDTLKKTVARKEKLKTLKPGEAKNVAMNGSISGGKNTPSQMKEESKVASTPATTKGEASPIVTRNNRADSIPAGPADDGYGDYNPCLI